MRWGRGFLAVAYVLASLLAQGFHDHGEGQPAPAPNRAPCAERRTHVEEPSSTTTAPHADDCLSCQWRSQASLIARVTADLHAEVVAPLVVAGRSIAGTTHPLRPKGRAPPAA